MANGSPQIKRYISECIWSERRAGPFDEENQAYEYTDDFRYNVGGTRIPGPGNKMLQTWEVAGIEAER